MNEWYIGEESGDALAVSRAEDGSIIAQQESFFIAAIRSAPPEVRARILEGVEPGLGAPKAPKAPEPLDYGRVLAWLLDHGGEAVRILNKIQDDAEVPGLFTREKDVVAWIMRSENVAINRVLKQAGATLMHALGPAKEKGVIDWLKKAEPDAVFRVLKEADIRLASLPGLKD